MTKLSEDKNHKELVKDVVCGMVKPKSEMPFKSEYKGKTYYFCWEVDKKMFESDPEHWIPNDERDDEKVVRKEV